MGETWSAVEVLRKDETPHVPGSYAFCASRGWETSGVPTLSGGQSDARKERIEEALGLPCRFVTLAVVAVDGEATE